MIGKVFNLLGTINLEEHTVVDVAILALQQNTHTGLDAARDYLSHGAVMNSAVSDQLLPGGDPETVTSKVEFCFLGAHKVW